MSSFLQLQSEIDSILALNVPPQNIIYANPCKTVSFIKHAAQVGVDLFTFDNEQELYKIASCFPKARLILRIKVDDSNSVCQFSAKFGADIDKASSLLSLAQNLNLNIVGVSFHVGSGCENAQAYKDAISNARYVFDIANGMGFKMTILDIGGGFPGTLNVPLTFDEMVPVINQALDEHFPENQDVSIIAEPGRYYVASAFVLSTLIVSKRKMIDRDGVQSVMYYVNDGVYGSFNCTIFDHLVVEPFPFIRNDIIRLNNYKTRQDELLNTTIWGPTCDSMDCIKKDFYFPEMEIGDWIVFPGMGAYTISAASTFNGFQLPVLKYFLSSYTLDIFKSFPNWPKLANILKIDMDESIPDSKEPFIRKQRRLNMISVS